MRRHCIRDTDVLNCGRSQRYAGCGRVAERRLRAMGRGAAVLKTRGGSSRAVEADGTATPRAARIPRGAERASQTERLFARRHLSRLNAVRPNGCSRVAPAFAWDYTNSKHETGVRRFEIGR